MGCLQLGNPEHHYFQPNCNTQVETPLGPVSYSINEDGFRASPRDTYQPGAFALVGDSKVEGWWVEKADTIGAQLEAGNTFGKLRELNVGIRFSGPSIQRLRLERALEHYPVKLILWFFNGTDTADERLAHSLALKRDKNGAPISLSVEDATPPGWLDFLQKLTRNKSLILRSIQMRLYDREVTRRVLSGDNAHDLCASFHSAMEVARDRKIPVLAVQLPLGPNIEKFPYMNVVGTEDSSGEIAACVKKEGVSIIDLRSKLSTNPELYWSMHRNMTAAGLRHLVEKLTPELKEAWAKLNQSPGSASGELRKK